MCDASFRSAPRRSRTSIASRSNSIVNRVRGSAHGSRTWRTPCVGQATRGGRARRYVWNWQLSRCRHARSSAWSYSGRSVAHSGHVQPPPSACPVHTSTRCSFTFSSTRVTVHGVFSPATVGRVRCLAWRLVPLLRSFGRQPMLPRQPTPNPEAPRRLRHA